MGRRGASLAELEALYRLRFERFASAATGMTGDIERGRDAVQSAFATAVRTRRSYWGDGPLEAWLWRIVVSEAARVRRAAPETEAERRQQRATRGKSLRIRSCYARRQRTRLVCRKSSRADLTPER